MSVQAVKQTDVFSSKAKKELNVNYFDFFLVFLKATLSMQWIY